MKDSSGRSGNRDRFTKSQKFTMSGDQNNLTEIISLRGDCEVMTLETLLLDRGRLSSMQRT